MKEIDTQTGDGHVTMKWSATEAKVAWRAPKPGEELTLTT